MSGALDVFGAALDGMRRKRLDEQGTIHYLEAARQPPALALARRAGKP